MENILSEARKAAEEAEVFVVSSEETHVQFEANRLKQLQTKQKTGVALRIIRKGRVGYAASTQLSDGEHLVNSAVETARFGTPARFQLPGPSSYPQVEVYDAAVESVPVEKMIELGKDMIDVVVSHTPGIMCEAGVTRGVVTVRIINSRGGQANYRKSIFSLGIEGSLINETDMLFVGENDSSCHPLLEPGAVTGAVLQQLELAGSRASAANGSMPVVFTPHGAASALLMPLMAAFSGKTVLEGVSPIGDKLGQPVFDEKLCLSDDPTVVYCPGSRPCDDEGVASRRTPLIEKGAVAGFLYDLQTAALAGTRSTGNGSRGRGGLPVPSPSAFIIAPGNALFDEMVEDMREGLVIEQVMGAGQGNILGGDFSGNVLLGYKVENGKIVGRVKDTMVSGNVYRILKEITAIGSEARWVDGILHTPHLYCPAVSVAVKG